MRVNTITIANLESELISRLNVACSPNELLGYMTAMLKFSGYSSDLTLHDLGDLDIVKTHFVLWGDAPWCNRLAMLSKIIVVKIQKINHPVIFKISSVLDHACALLEFAEEDDSSFLEFCTPSEN